MMIALSEGGKLQQVASEAIEILAVDVPSPSIIQGFLETLPERAFGLGVRVLFAIVCFLIGVQLIKLIRRIIKRSMKRASAEVGVMQFVDSFVKAALYVVMIFFLASYFGVDAASIVALLGSAGVAIGLAVQGSLSNLAGGVLILLLKPFVVGDYIVESATGKEGTVKEIQIFYTKLITPDNKTIVLPNGNLANTSIVNVTAAQNRRVDVIVSISYSADLKKAKEVLLQVLEEDPAVRKDKEMIVFVDELAASGVNLGVRCWFDNEDYWTGKWRVTENCKLALDQAGIEIPFNQLDVHLREKAEKK
ncbi:MAG: mechanosensitive ion channel family protein [Acetatifactor sp.]|nr:mechanosensitive ion channel family protein [Acetatifactor sp.]